MAKKWDSWDDMPLDELEQRAQQIRQRAASLVSTVNELLPGLLRLTQQERLHLPRLRKGQHEAYFAVLDGVELRPQLFESLADEDEGFDPGRLETQVVRERIAKHRIFGDIADELQPLADLFGDTRLALAERFNDFMLAAYRIAKTHAAKDAELRTKIAPAIDFMSKGARAKKTGKKG